MGCLYSADDCQWQRELDVVSPNTILGRRSLRLTQWGYFEAAIWRSESWSDTKNAFTRGYLDIGTALGSGLADVPQS